VALDQAIGGVVAARRAHARDSLIGLLVARDVTGEGVRVLFGTRAALVLGLGIGLGWGLLALLRGRARG
jgi:hypothetical protein